MEERNSPSSGLPGEKAPAADAFSKPDNAASTQEGAVAKNKRKSANGIKHDPRYPTNVIRRATRLRARMNPQPRLLTPDEVAAVEREGLFEVPAHRRSRD